MRRLLVVLFLFASAVAFAQTTQDPKEKEFLDKLGTHTGNINIEILAASADALNLAAYYRANMQSALDAKEAEIKDLQDKLAALESRVAALEAAPVALDTRLKALEDYFRPLSTTGVTLTPIKTQ